MPRAGTPLPYLCRVFQYSPKVAPDTYQGFDDVHLKFSKRHQPDVLLVRRTDERRAQDGRHRKSDRQQNLRVRAEEVERRAGATSRPSLVMPQLGIVSLYLCRIIQSINYHYCYHNNRGEIKGKVLNMEFFNRYQQYITAEALENSQLWNRLVDEEEKAIKRELIMGTSRQYL